MNYDALIFDVDGTLWDSCESCAEGWNLILEKLGNKTKLTGEQIGSVAGKPLDACINILVPDIGDQFDDFFNLLQTEETKVIEEKGARMYEGVLEGFELLSKKYPLFLVSNCQTKYLDAFLNFSKIQDYLKGWDCFGTNNIDKPIMLAKMKEEYGLQKPVYIGDTAHDSESAKAAGMDFIFAAYGFGDVQDAPKTFDSFKNIVEYLA